MAARQRAIDIIERPAGGFLADQNRPIEGTQASGQGFGGSDSFFVDQDDEEPVINWILFRLESANFFPARTVQSEQGPALLNKAGRKFRSDSEIVCLCAVPQVQN